MVNFCAGFATLLSVAAVVLLIFGEIGQIETSIVTRHLRIVTIGTSGVGAAIAEHLDTGMANVTGLYNTATTYKVKTGNGTHDGLRKNYEFGIWNYCATNGDIGTERSYCTPRAFGAPIQPAAVFLQDVPTKFAEPLQAILPDSVFTADDYLGKFTTAASYLVFVGAIAAALCMLIGFVAHKGAYVLGAILALISALTLAIGLVIYTVIFSRIISAISDVQVAENVDLGVDVAYGNALWLMWGAAAAIIFAVLPFSIACCTGRTDSRIPRK
ncbi:actin cortical patch SUR7/pH-response regulator pali [Leucosporidium creatinivorum]|uniref:Actin cortical patch SUR7/pH-response regulator pali n=1 Tax=Leucosporidium creatinivorum TaxID=106004 RepID=A0A1Y2D8E4_9BASI|nr:actin cortical patch SUR7/pH-response regulator pali [Leucosporidium creatinivorum]